MTEQEILAKEIGGISIGSMTSITFLQWIALKVSGLQAYDQRVQKLVSRVSNPMIGKMSDDNKIQAVREMEALGIEIK